MFSKVSRAFVAALMFFALFAAATGPLPVTRTVTTTATATATAPAQQCNTGPIQCCNSVQSASSGPVGLILGLLHIVLQDLTVLVGLGCVSLGSSCSAQTVCCQDNSFHGLIAIGCTPIDIL